MSCCNCSICDTPVAIDATNNLVHVEYDGCKHEPKLERRVEVLMRASHVFLNATQEVHEETFWNFIADCTDDWRLSAMAQTAYLVHKSQRANHPEQYGTLWAPMSVGEAIDAYYEVHGEHCTLSFQTIERICQEVFYRGARNGYLDVIEALLEAS